MLDLHPPLMSCGHTYLRLLLHPLRRERKLPSVRVFVHGQRDDRTEHMEYQTHFQAALEFAFHNESSIWDYFHSAPQMYQDG